MDLLLEGWGGWRSEAGGGLTARVLGCGEGGDFRRREGFQCNGQVLPMGESGGWDSSCWLEPVGMGRGSEEEVLLPVTCLLVWVPTLVSPNLGNASQFPHGVQWVGQRKSDPWLSH